MSIPNEWSKDPWLDVPQDMTDFIKEVTDNPVEEKFVRATEAADDGLAGQPGSSSQTAAPSPARRVSAQTSDPM